MRLTLSASLAPKEHKGLEVRRVRLDQREVKVLKVIKDLREFKEAPVLRRSALRVVLAPREPSGLKVLLVRPVRKGPKELREPLARRDLRVRRVQ